MCERAPRYERGGPSQVFSSLLELLRYIVLFYLNANSLRRLSLLPLRSRFFSLFSLFAYLVSFISTNLDFKTDSKYHRYS